ncbi:hypothetical protein ES703_21581 [subsurface metagenome]
MKRRLISVLILVLLLPLLGACSPIPKINVVAATLPVINVGPGEHTIFRFVVESTKDTEIEKLVLETKGEVEIRWLHWYDETQGTAIPAGSFQTSENNKLTIWPMMQTVSIPAGVTKTFSIQGEVSGQGDLFVQLVDMVVREGSVEGIPSAILTLEVQKAIEVLDSNKSQRVHTQSFNVRINPLEINISRLTDYQVAPGEEIVIVCRVKNHSSFIEEVMYNLESNYGLGGIEAIIDYDGPFKPKNPEAYNWHKVPVFPGEEQWLYVSFPMPVIYEEELNFTITVDRWLGPRG